MFNLFKYFSFLMIINSIIFSIFSKNWLQLWMFLEFNMMSFVPIMYANNKSNHFLLKYFFIQSMASSILLFSLIFFIFFNNLIFTNLLTISLFSKLGLFPLYSWFIQLSHFLSWQINMILFTMQKFIPLFCISLNPFNSLLIILLLINVIIGISGMWYNSSIRKILAYSSISHMSWMLFSFLMSKNLWILYLLIYSIIILSMMNFFNHYKIFNLGQFSMINNNLMKILTILNFFSLAGLPPLLGFLPKWLIIFYTSKKLFFIISFLLISSLISMMIYSRMFFILMFSNPQNFYNCKFKMNFVNIFALLPFSIIIF